MFALPSRVLYMQHLHVYVVPRACLDSRQACRGVPFKPRTSYDATSYDATSYDATSYDATSYDATSYDK